MRDDRTLTVLLCIALASVGAFAWWLQLRPSLEPEPEALGTLPHEIRGWRGEEIPLEATVESVLQADYNVQRVYLHPTGRPIWLYIGYYGTARGGRPEHTPRGCYTGAGWGIESSRIIEHGPQPPHQATEYLVERDGRRRLVHYWFRSHRRTGMTGGLDQNIDRFVGRLLEGRADGALVRLSTPIDAEGEVVARSVLRSFAAALDPLLAERWPAEHPEGEDGAAAGRSVAADASAPPASGPAPQADRKSAAATSD